MKEICTTTKLIRNLETNFHYYSATIVAKIIAGLKTFACVSLKYRKHCEGGGGW